MTYLYGGVGIVGKARDQLRGGTLGIALPYHPQLGYRFLTAAHVVGEPGEEIRDAAGKRIGEVVINTPMEKGGAMQNDIAIGVFDEDVYERVRPMLVGWMLQTGPAWRQLRGMQGNTAIDAHVEFVGAVSGYRNFQIGSAPSTFRWFTDGREHHLRKVVKVTVVGGEAAPLPGDSGGAVFRGTTLIGIYSGVALLGDSPAAELFTDIGFVQEEYL